MINKEIRCENCLFGDMQWNIGGYCRRYPPKVFTDFKNSDNIVFLSPQINGGDFCGEFKPRNKPNEKILVEGGVLRN